MKTFPLFCVLLSVSAWAVDPIREWQTLRAGDKPGTLKVETRRLLQVNDPITSVKIEVQSKPLDGSLLQKVAIIGDTGCRLKDGKNGSGSYQDCTNPQKWPFPKLMQLIEAEHPDLIIHLGDYHYRESCSYDPKCSTYSKATGYTWVPWDLDFFAPADAMLKAHPWIFVRGNHEECSRAGLGWTQFLARDNKASCQTAEAPEILEGPKWVLINFDSTWISDFPDFSPAQMKSLVQSLDDIAKKLPKGKRVYLFTHKPILGVAELHHVLAPVNVNFRTAFEKSQLKSKVSVIFSGHVHSSQIALAENLPVQVMEGNSGTSLDKVQKAVGADTVKSLGLTAWRQLTTGFGYALLNMGGPQQVTFKDLKGQIVYQCDLADHAKSCLPNNP